MTIRELFERCYTAHWNVERYLNSGWAKEVRGYYVRHIDLPLGEKDILSLGPKAVRTWHRSIPQRTSANRSLEILSRMFTFAQEEELITGDTNPCRGVKAHVERKRQRFASEQELGRIGEELQKEEKIHPVKVAFCRLLALTGARPKSLMQARVDQLATHGDTGLLRLAGKTSAASGEDEVIIFPPEALRIAQELPQREDGLLIGPVEYKRFWERITRKAGCPGLWLRDFRRAFATVGLSSGVGIDVIGKLLNHRSSQTTEIYAKLLPLARLKAANFIAGEMSSLLG